MKLSARRRNDLATYARLAAAGLVIGFVFQAAHSGGIVWAPQGSLFGAGISIAMTALHMELFRDRWPRLPYIADVLLRMLITNTVMAVCFLLLILFVVEHPAGRPDVVDVVRHPAFLTSLGLSMLIYGVIAGVMRFSGFLGPGVLWRYLTGRYHRPRSERRIFLFIDLDDATTHAERLGPERYFDLLNAYFDAMTRPIEEARAEVYQYVGDQIVLTWPFAQGAREGRCLKLPFAIADALAERAARFQARFGFVPAFKAALHGGDVISAELGSIKTELVFSGDVLNTTQRIQGQCAVFGRRVLASEELLRQIGPVAGIRTEPLGEVALKGKAQPLAIAAVSAA